MAIVRHAEEADVTEIYKLGKNVPEFSVNDKTVNFWPQEIIQNLIRSHDAIVLVAEESTKIRGFLIANCNNAFKKILIENIYVSPDFRNSGIGEDLLLHLLSLAKKNGFEYVAALIPTEANGALKPYTNAGFAKGETFRWIDKSLSEDFKSK